MAAIVDTYINPKMSMKDAIKLIAINLDIMARTRIFL